MHLRSKGYRGTLLGFGLTVLATALSSAWGQVDLSAWPQVRLEVLAVEPDGSAVQGLGAGTLLVRGAGKPRPVVDLTPATEAQSVCVLIDASDIDRLSLIKSKATKLLRNLAPEDEVCVAAFSSDLSIEQELTGNRRAATDKLTAIRPAGGTQLRDALLNLSAYMRGAAQNRSRAIILFSDGSDHKSAASKLQLKQGMEAEGSPVIHMIVLPQAFGNARRKQYDPAEGTAFQMTELGGGMTYFPHNMGDMNALVEALPETLRTRYLLTYTAENPTRDGHEERLEILFDKAHRNQKARVQAPEGYYAPSQ